MEETALRIRLLGDPALRRKARKVSQVTVRQREILSEMTRLMYDSKGIGLAASQVGIRDSLIVADIGAGLYKLVNPRIVKKEGNQAIEEGCLSLPGICIKVKRANKVAVEAQDDSGAPLKIEAEGLLACVFQHELDHLNGKLIIDYASLFKKLRLKRALNEITCRLQL